MENRSESIGKLTEALSKAQAEIRGAKKDSNNPFFRMEYASLASVWEAAREPLTKNGLAVIQATKVIDGKLMLETVLSHASGEWFSSIYPLNPMKQLKNEGWVPSEDPQSMGSCFSYGRRYSLAAITGIATADDDGNDATGKYTGKQRTDSRKEEKIQETPPIKVTNVTKKGYIKKDKSTGTVYTVHAENAKYTTLESGIATNALASKVAGQSVVIGYKAGDFGPEIVSFRVGAQDPPKTEQPQGEIEQPPPDDNAQDTGFPTSEEEQEALGKAGMIPTESVGSPMSIDEYREKIKSFNDLRSLNKWMSEVKTSIPLVIMSEVSRAVNDRMIGFKKK